MFDCVCHMDLSTVLGPCERQPQLCLILLCFLSLCHAVSLYLTHILFSLPADSHYFKFEKVTESLTI